MALQGTLDTFALPDVLRLLAATQKTGRLRITGGRGDGSIWMVQGAASALEASHAPYATEPVDALFELLRFTEGSFTFDAETAHESPGEPGDIEELLVGAEALLSEWREIESVVPSMDAWVTLRRTLEGPSITIEQGHWRTLVTIGAGATVRGIGVALELHELPVSRAVRDLVELGVVDIADSAPTGHVDEPVSEPVERAPLFGAGDGTPAVAAEETVSPRDEDAEDEPVGVPVSATDDHELPMARPIRARRPRTTIISSHEPSEPEAFVPLELPGHHAPAAYDPDPVAEAGDEDASAEDLAAAFPGLAGLSPESGPEDAELARQLATLSPEAADAVRAAAAAATDEEREAALDEVAGDDDQPINRGLLLKFLSSVKS